MTAEQLRESWPFGPTFYPRELAQILEIRPIIAKALIDKLKVSSVKCAVGRQYHTQDFFMRLSRKLHLLDWAQVQNEVHNISETQLSLELGSGFPPYYTTRNKQ